MFDPQVQLLLRLTLRDGSPDNGNQPPQLTCNKGKAGDNARGQRDWPDHSRRL